MRTLNMGAVILKLNGILGDRFGVSVQYISISNKNRHLAKTLETVKRNSGAPMIVGHNQLIVPLRVEGSLVGATQVTDINNLHPRELSAVKATIDLMVNEEVKTWAPGFTNLLPFELRARA